MLAALVPAGLPAPRSNERVTVSWRPDAVHPLDGA
jgi:hypothetical protein